MSILNIVTHPAAILRQKAEPVAKVDAKVRELMNNMLETMYDGERGIGLAAPQVDMPLRVLVCDTTYRAEGVERKPFLMANPEIIWSDPAETFVWEEGCLSVPDVYAAVTRPKRVKVRYLDENNETRELEAEDLFSQCLQHEIDHLNGILFFDHISKLKRDMLLKRYDKLRRFADEE